LVNVPGLATGEPALEASLGGRRRQLVSLADHPTANHRQPGAFARLSGHKVSVIDHRRADAGTTL